MVVESFPKERISELQLSDTFNEAVRREATASCEIEKIYAPSDLVDNYYDVVEEIDETLPEINSDNLITEPISCMITPDWSSRNGIA